MRKCWGIIPKILLIINRVIIGVLFIQLIPIGEDLMSNNSIFIDLPNFYSRFIDSGIDKRKNLRDYFLYWLDLDMMVKELTEKYSGIWVFYSGERIGPSNERIVGDLLQKYIKRINSLEGVTAKDVNIPGEQREPIKVKCNNCGHENVSEFISEKGVDASITVHLFDTMDSWDTAFLLSGDADFVPAVASLRRRGKIVRGVGFHDASFALVRECYDYINIVDTYLKQDYLIYSLFKEYGIIQNWLNSAIVLTEQNNESKEVYLEMNLGSERFLGSQKSGTYCVDLRCIGPVDLTSRSETIKDLKSRYNEFITEQTNREGKLFGYYIINIESYTLGSLNRRVESFLNAIEGKKIIDIGENITCKVEFMLNEKTGKLNPIEESN